MTLTILPDESMAGHCTLELGGVADHFTTVTTLDELREAWRWAMARALPITLLGGGSNVIVDDAGVGGLVVRVALRGIAVEPQGGAVHVTAAAGEPWAAFVSHAVDAAWGGIECLAGIPGSVGATPIQNVGAYGQEVAQTIDHVTVWDPARDAVREIDARACGFAYRDSAFKRGVAPCAGTVVLSVTFALRPGGGPSVHYPELARALGTEIPSLRAVHDAVIALRRSKSMVLEANDVNRRSVGSFFTNPIVSRALADEVSRRAAALGGGAIPAYDTPDGHVKLAAGALIERSGFAKGMRVGNVGISTHHALALVHHGGGTTHELLALADTIRDGVQRTFGVTLALEPVRIGP